MGYQRGERGRLASLITVIILGTAVVSIDHISGRSVGTPVRSEAANQVISMELATASPASHSCAESEAAQPHTCAVDRAPTRRQSRDSAASSRTAGREPIINSIKLKARELQDTDWPILARLSGITKKPSFLELQTASIPPLQNRLVAAASQVSLIKNVSIRMDGEIRISKAPAPPAAHQIYFLRVVSQREAKAVQRSCGSQPSFILAPVPQAWKSLRRTS
jgi:hypothetical protein